MSIITLPANQPAERFYRGGSNIAAFRGITSDAEHSPEDWIGSATSVWGEHPVGQTILPDGTSLAAHIAADPAFWLGSEHLARFGADTKILVKLLDAGERLPVHVHPYDDWSFAKLSRPHGKAEAWYVIEGGTVAMAFTQSLSLAELEELVAAQDTAKLLSLLHHVDVSPGQVVFVPPGMPHAIGEGMLLVEVQEPEDQSIFIEHAGYPIDGGVSGHLGISTALALTAVDRNGWDAGAVQELVVPASADGDGSILPPLAAPYFRMQRHIGAGTLEPGFAVGIVLAGAGAVNGDPVTRGTTFIAPHAAGELVVDRDLELLLSRPPALSPETS